MCTYNDQYGHSILNSNIKTRKDASHINMQDMNANSVNSKKFSGKV